MPPKILAATSAVVTFEHLGHWCRTRWWAFGCHVYATLSVDEARRRRLFDLAIHLLTKPGWVGFISAAIRWLGVSMFVHPFNHHFKIWKHEIYWLLLFNDVIQKSFAVKLKVDHPNEYFNWETALHCAGQVLHHHPSTHPRPTWPHRNARTLAPGHCQQPPSSGSTWAETLGAWVVWMLGSPHFKNEIEHTHIVWMWDHCSARIGTVWPFCLQNWFHFCLTLPALVPDFGKALIASPPSTTSCRRSGWTSHTPASDNIR